MFSWKEVSTNLTSAKCGDIWGVQTFITSIKRKYQEAICILPQVGNGSYYLDQLFLEVLQWLKKLVPLTLKQFFVCCFSWSNPFPLYLNSPKPSSFHATVNVNVFRTHHMKQNNFKSIKSAFRTKESKMEDENILSNSPC